MPDEKTTQSLQLLENHEKEERKLNPLQKRTYDEVINGIEFLHWKKICSDRTTSISTDDQLPLSCYTDRKSAEEYALHGNAPRVSTASGGVPAISRTILGKKLKGSAFTNLSRITPLSLASPGTLLSPPPAFQHIDATPQRVMRDGIVDIDAPDAGNVLSQHWVAKNVASMWQKREQELEICADYIADQSEVTGKMRAILIDWLVDVHAKFRLRAEVLHLAVCLVDRYLSVAQTRRARLQLVGVSAMLIASKYEEICAPEVSEFVAVTDSAYARAEILAMEAAILNALGFRLDAPSALRLLQRNLKALRACCCDGVRLVAHLAQYCSELA
eukprot:IDg18334t1